MKSFCITGRKDDVRCRTIPYYYQPYQPYQPPMADQLTQLRQSYQPMQQPQQAPASPSIVWVQSEMEAANYLVAPNSAVTLWDSNSPVVYLKQADASGKPSMKIYDLVERNQRARTGPTGSGGRVCAPVSSGGVGGPPGCAGGYKYREGGCGMNPFFQAMGGNRQPNMMQAVSAVHESNERQGP